MIAEAPMLCKNGRCERNLLLSARVDSGCTDVEWSMENVRVHVSDSTLVGDPNGLIAVDGIALLAD